MASRLASVSRVATPIQLARRSGRLMLDALIPPVCTACRKPLREHHTLCAPCWSRIRFIRPPLCDALGIPLPYDIGETVRSALALKDPPIFDRARSVAAYEGTMRDLVHDLKFRDRNVGIVLFTRWLQTVATPLMDDSTIIIPVPLSRRRLMQRRFNQAALLSSALAKAVGRDHAPAMLKRVRNTQSQIGLTRAQRESNVAGAFRIAKRHHKRLDARHVLVVDDVITTGATINACARSLRRAGAHSVDVVSLARALPDQLTEVMNIV